MPKHAATIVQLVKVLLMELDKSGIPYCHWKSNIDLDKALAAEGDLDLLVDRRFSSSFGQLVSQLGFKRGIVGWKGQFPGVEHYLGWDEESDVLVHLHVYYQLVLGRAYVKGIHLPLEQRFLSDREKQGLITITAPECELLAFVLRCILKARPSDLLRWRRCTKRTVEELEWLAGDAKADIVDELLCSCQVSAQLFEAMETAIRKGSPWRMWWLKRRLSRTLRPFQRVGWLVRVARPTIARFGDRMYSILGRVPPKQKPNAGGMIIAVVGSDGSGKSTLVSQLHRWLSTHYAVRAYHLGKPKQPMSGRILLCVAALMAKLCREREGSQPHFLAGASRVLTQLCVARGRQRTYLMIRRWVGRGGIAVTDRYPLHGVNMDSMFTIAQYGHSRNVILRWLTQRTAKYYQAFTQPDLLLVLRISLDVAAKRRPEDTREYLLSRAKAVDSIAPGQNVVILDAERELSQVIKEAKRAVWRWL